MHLSIQRLRSAFLPVKDNNGCAGVDGVTIGQYARNLDINLKRLMDEISSGDYFPHPLMKILVAKKNGEPRPICIPTVRDRVIHRAVLDQIEPLLEKEFETCSYAYRKGRSVRQVVYQIKEYYEQGYRWVVDADIDAFFDNVSHPLLYEKFERVVQDATIRKLIRQWVQVDVWDGTSLSAIRKGIPQGSSISPVLANLFLDELDETLLSRGYKYMRYADDYLILCKSPVEADRALALSKKVLASLLLELDEERITSFDQGFKYLGVVFLKSMVMKPFETQQRERKVLFYPSFFDFQSYINRREKDAESIHHGTEFGPAENRRPADCPEKR